MKGQSALEYLMTYGWAILIVIVVIGALYATGLTRPCRWTGTQVREFPDFSVENVRVNTSHLVFDVNYIRSGTIYLLNTTVEGDARGTTRFDPRIPVPPASRVSVTPLTYTIGGSRGDCYSFNVFVHYNFTVAGGVEQTNATGRISGVVS